MFKTTKIKFRTSFKLLLLFGVVMAVSILSEQLYYLQIALLIMHFGPFLLLYQLLTYMYVACLQ